VVNIVSRTTYSGLYAVLERESKLQKRLLITQRDNYYFFALEFVQTYKVCLRVPNRQGGEFPLAVFLCGDLGIDINKNINKNINKTPLLRRSNPTILTLSP